MSKLKPVEEMVETAIEWLAQRDPRLVPAEIAYHKTYKDHISSLFTQDRQDTLAAIIEALEEERVGERPTWETGDPQWWDECAGGYNQALDLAILKVKEILG